MINLMLQTVFADIVLCSQVLTDLRDDWSLLWLNERVMTTAGFDSRSDAIGFIEKLLTPSASGSKSTDKDISKEDPVAARLAKRHRIAESLITSIGASDALSEQIQSLQGAVPEAELMQMRAAQALRELYEHPAAAAWAHASQPSSPSYIT